MSEFRHCQHVFPDGHTCGSASVTDRDYCYHHLSHRGRRIRMARARSQQQRLFLDLPPLDSLSAIHAAGSQIVQALAADVIDVRYAQAILSGLRFLARTIAKAETPAWHNNVYQNDQPQTYDNFESNFGLPANFDLKTPPEVAFPPNSNSGLSSRAQQSGVEGPALSDHRPVITENLPESPPMPHSGNYCSDHHSKDCECTIIRADYPLTPEMVECIEVGQTYGADVAAARSKQLLRNSERRRLNSARKRYAAIALEHNMRHAADLIAQRKLADEKLAAERAHASARAAKPGKKPPRASVAATPPDVIEAKSIA